MPTQQGSRACLCLSGLHSALSMHMHMLRAGEPPIAYVQHRHNCCQCRAQGSATLRLPPALGVHVNMLGSMEVQRLHAQDRPHHHTSLSLGPQPQSAGQQQGLAWHQTGQPADLQSMPHTSSMHSLSHVGNKAPPAAFTYCLR